MRIVTDLTELERQQPTILTIGAFDGVHRGHQFLIRQVTARARHLDADSMVLTFDPRPQVVLRSGEKQLTDAHEKARIIRALNPHVLALLPFSRETSMIPAGQFLVSILDHVNLAEVWVGADFAFGHKREGDVPFLIRTGQNSGFAVHVVARQGLNHASISSSRARELVAAGEVVDAATILGHYPSIGGTVVRGAGRGHDLGFPTANIAPENASLIPGIGIYAGFLRSESGHMAAAVSVGHIPVFGGGDLVVEAYILDFQGDLRDQHVHIDFVARLRDEKNFESVDALVAQMHRDVDDVRSILGQSEEPGELILPQA